MTAARPIPARATGSAPAVMPSGVEWTRVRRARLEARWFVEGDLPRPLRPTRRSAQRTDQYHVPTLSPDLSIKRRGDRGRLEAKTRCGVEVLTIGGARNVAERWQKWRAPHPDDQLPGPWCVVDKQIWTLDGFEVTRLTVAERRWWTFAFPLDQQGAPRNPQLARWLAHVADSDGGASYASWLIERVDATTAAL